MRHVAVIWVLLLLLFVAASEAVKCTSAEFIEVERLERTQKGKKSKSRHRSKRMPRQNDLHYGEQAVFPELSFNCSGFLTHWIFTASYREGKKRTQFPELHVWRPGPVNTYMLVHTTRVNFNEPTFDQFYNISLLHNPLLVQAGDVLGIFQPEEKTSLYSILYSNSRTETNVYLQESSSRLNILHTNDWNRVYSEQSNIPSVSAVIVPSPSSSTSISVSSATRYSEITIYFTALPSNAILTTPVQIGNPLYSVTPTMLLLSSSTPTLQSSPTFSHSSSKMLLLMTKISTMYFPPTTTFIPSQTVLHVAPVPSTSTLPSPTQLLAVAKPTTASLMVSNLLSHATFSVTSDGQHNSFTGTSQAWTVSKHPPHKRADSNADMNTPSYTTPKPSLGTLPGNDSANVYIFVIVALLGLTIVSTVIAATAFCIVFAVTRRKSKPVVTVICPSPSSRLHNENITPLTDDGSTCPHTVCNLEPVPIYEGATLVRPSRGHGSHSQSTSLSSSCSSGIPQHTETTLVHLTEDSTTPAESSQLPSNVPIQQNVNPNYDRIESRNSNSHPEEVNHRHAKPPVSPYELPLLSGNSSLCGYDLCVPDEYQRKQFIQSGGYEFDQELYTSLVQQAQRQTVQEPTFFKEVETYWQPSSSAPALYTQLSSKRFREIPRQLIEITEYLGSGQFGTVNKAVWKSRSGEVEVAVKMIKAGASETEKVKFLQEAAINGQFHHPNVVKLLGMVTVGEPAMIVLELLRNGNLKKYLSSKRHMNKDQPPPPGLPVLLLDCCRQVVCGMVYLASKAFVHRDLAARNILVSNDLVCKVADFGMSRDLMEKSYYVSQGGPIPIKWTAPEALYYRKYSTYSDVWSFGVVMYEIWSLGKKPFPSLTNEQYMDEIDEGHRLHPPPGCPRMMYQLMMECWHPDSSCRPSFETIACRLHEDPTKLLELGASEEELRECPEAGRLCASMETGHALFQDLQNKYWTHS